MYFKSVLNFVNFKKVKNLSYLVIYYLKNRMEGNNKFEYVLL